MPARLYCTKEIPFPKLAFPHLEIARLKRFATSGLRCFTLHGADRIPPTAGNSGGTPVVAAFIRLVGKAS